MLFVLDYDAKMKPETEQNLKFQKKCYKKIFFFDKSGV